MLEVVNRVVFGDDPDHVRPVGGPTELKEADGEAQDDGG
jgi:hypothetical protein